MTRALMLYDADCGFCTRAAGQVWRLRVDVDMAPMQRTALSALGVDESRALREMPFVAADGTVSYGHRAWAAVLRTGPLPARLAGSTLDAAVLAPVASRFYTWVSRNRHRLPGGTASCAIDGQH